MSTPRLELDDIRLAYGAMPILADISLSVGAGEFVSILGPSGAGKSTLFRILTGVATPQGGDIRFDGQPIAETTTKPFAFMP
jgi:ABC-type Fe3+/spermidine/putrescine transport system ATPase subunit